MGSFVAMFAVLITVVLAVVVVPIGAAHVAFILVVHLVARHGTHVAVSFAVHVAALLPWCSH